MVIVCPNCSVSYHIAAESLGERGRTVRCTQCRHSWQVPGARAIVDEEAAEAETEAGADAVAAPAENVTRPADEDTPIGQAGEMPAKPLAEARPDRPAELNQSVVPDQSVEDVETAARRGFSIARRGSRTKIRHTTPRKPWPRPHLAQVIVVMGAIFLVAAAVWRDHVVEYVPDAAAIYAFVGLPANPRGLAFEGLTTTEVMENGVPMLVVSGHVQNMVDRKADVPRLRLAVHGPTGREIYVWTAMPSRAHLLPGESLPFWSQLASPPAEGREVSVRFLSGRDIDSGLTYRVGP